MDEQLLNVKDLAQRLNVKPSWVYARTRERGPDTIPVVRVGKYLRFRVEDVISWLERQSHEAEQ